MRTDAAVLDANIVIDLIHGVSMAWDTMNAYNLWLLSKIGTIEVLCGRQSEQEEHLIREFLDDFIVIPLDDDIAEETIRIRRAHRKLRLPDAVIWATARLMDVPLLTRNTRDFPSGDPSILIPYHL